MNKSKYFLFWLALALPGSGDAAEPSPHVIALAAGTTHVCALFSDHRLKCWGDGTHGKLGLGNAAARGMRPGEMGENLPFLDLGTGRTALSVSCGDRHTCALLDDHSVKCWGRNDEGQFGEMTSIMRGDEPDQMGDALPRMDLGPGKSALAVVATRTGTCVLLDDQSVKCWGRLTYGDNDLGRRAFPIPLGHRPTPLSAAAYVGWLAGQFPTPPLFPTYKALTLTSGTGAHVCALLDDGSVKCWGENGNGQLGIENMRTEPLWSEESFGDNLPKVKLGTGRYAKAVSAGYAHSCALLDDGTVKCWGQNAYGQLGQGDGEYHGQTAESMGDFLRPIALFSDLGVESVSCGAGFQCCAISRLTHLLKCWGANGFGALGIETSRLEVGNKRMDMGEGLPFVDLGSLNSTRQVVLGDDFGCALLQNRRVKCWGRNTFGQLGLGDMQPRGNRPGDMGDALPYVELQ